MRISLSRRCFAANDNPVKYVLGSALPQRSARGLDFLIYLTHYLLSENLRLSENGAAITYALNAYVNEYKCKSLPFLLVINLTFINFIKFLEKYSLSTLYFLDSINHHLLKCIISNINV